jgi:hypothetical protein
MLGASRIYGDRLTQRRCDPAGGMALSLDLPVDGAATVNGPSEPLHTVEDALSGCTPVTGSFAGQGCREACSTNTPPSEAAIVTLASEGDPWLYS